MAHISASLLAADFAHLGAEVTEVERAGVDSLHFDLMDGHYVPNFALTPQHLEALRPVTSLPFHVHLEVDNPDQILEAFHPLRAEVVIVQLDTLADPRATFTRIRSANSQVGLGLNPDDEPDLLKPLLADVDLVTVMGVLPGFGGQRIRDGTAGRITRVARMIDEERLPVEIAVDGGVKLENAGRLIDAGADILIMGTGLFHQEHMADVVSKLKDEQ